MENLLKVKSIANRYKIEACKFAGKEMENWYIGPRDPIWIKLERVLEVCENNNWDTTTFINSRFKALGPWVRDKLGLEYFPPKFLLAPKLTEIYENYIKDLKETYKLEKDTTEYEEILSQIEDGVYLKNKMKLEESEILEFSSWFSPVFLASSEYLIESFSVKKIKQEDLPEEVIELWNQFYDNPHFYLKVKNIRKKAEENV